MAKKRESRRQRKMRERLEEVFGGKWWKVHGGPFQEAGIPDLNGCVDGLYIAIEVKEEDGETSPIQDEQIEDFKRNGAICFAESSIERAVARVAEAILISTAGSKVRARAKRFLSVSRAEGGQDVRHTRRNRAADHPVLRRLDSRTKDQQKYHVDKAARTKPATGKRR